MYQEKDAEYFFHTIMNKLSDKFVHNYKGSLYGKGDTVYFTTLTGSHDEGFKNLDIACTADKEFNCEPSQESALYFVSKINYYVDSRAIKKYGLALKVSKLYKDTEKVIVTYGIIPLGD